MHRRARTRSRSRAADPLLLLLLLFLQGTTVFLGCRGGEQPLASEVALLPAERSLGGPGTVPGRFRTPRAIDFDPEDGSLWVIDKTARVQRIASDGRPLGGWTMPDSALGMPTGITVDDAGRVIVPDTHYHRVIVHDREGRELLRFGSYGPEPGRFVYPTDVVVLPDGRFLVSEYGGADRVQCFAADGTYLFGFDGSETGKRFRRPQAIALSADGEELVVVDACNHRLVIVDLEGRPRRVLGGLGRAPGELAYPYGLEVDADGSILVAEQGNNRLQRLDPRDGRSLGIWGGFGEAMGRLRYPWSVTRRDGRVAVLDTGNDRVLLLDAAALRQGEGPPR